MASIRNMFEYGKVDNPAAYGASGAGSFRGGDSSDEEDDHWQSPGGDEPGGPVSGGLAAAPEGRPAVFEELPSFRVVNVYQEQQGPLLLHKALIYVIEIQYRGQRWRISKQLSSVLGLHWRLKARSLDRSLHRFRDRWKERMHEVILRESVHHDDNHASDEGGGPLLGDTSIALPSTLAAADVCKADAMQFNRQRASSAMLRYLGQLLTPDVINTPEVLSFLETSRHSFDATYGPKCMEGWVRVVKGRNAISCTWCGVRKSKRVWAVLKPGFLALFKEPADEFPADIVHFDLLPPSDRPAYLSSSGGAGGEGVDGLAWHTRDDKVIGVVQGGRSMYLSIKRARTARQWVRALREEGTRPGSWTQQQRFGSFAPERRAELGTQAQWLVDGEAAFGAIADAIRLAQKEIYIMGWWISPEIYLERPFADHPSSQLRSLLEERARVGVKVYLLMWKELSLATKIGSARSKQEFQALHPNVHVVRHPDTLSSSSRWFLWSHHEKLVLVDNKVALMGGLDLCHGRYDTSEHAVTDDSSSFFPGKDYYNPRVAEPAGFDDWHIDEIARRSTARMPWHDVHCALWGAPVADLARHFVQRWNHALGGKSGDHRGCHLLLPRDPEAMRRLGVVGWGTSPRGSAGGSPAAPASELISLASPLRSPQRRSPAGSTRADSDSGAGEDDSLGADPWSSAVTSASGGVAGTAAEGAGAGERKPRRKLQVDVAPGVGGQGPAPLSPGVGAGGGNRGAKVSCWVQIVRSVGRWSVGSTLQQEASVHDAYCGLIQQARRFIYIEAQFVVSNGGGSGESDVHVHNRVVEVLVERLVRAVRAGTPFRVYIVMPLEPGFPGEVDDSSGTAVRAIMHLQFQTLSRGPKSLIGRFRALCPRADPSDFISICSLRSHGRHEVSGRWATSQVYVHSKLMIVDDERCVIGSANINDRSLLGARDSEIAAVVEDSPADVAAGGCGFCKSLRLQLFVEHLGLRSGEEALVDDPVQEAVFRGLWQAVAGANTAVYDRVFRCTPNDAVRSRSQLKAWRAAAGGKLKASLTNDEAGLLGGIRGGLVLFPLEFMRDENLRPTVLESSMPEYYLSTQLFS